MNRQGIYHEPKSRYAYPYDKKTLHLRIRTAKDDLIQVKVIAFDPYSYIPNEHGEWIFDLSKRFFIEMKKEHSDELFDYWFCEVHEIDTLRIRYAFVLEDHLDSMFYGPYLTCSMSAYENIAEKGNHYFNFPYINEEDLYKGPDWVKNSVWYQIFPERFHRSDQGPEIQGLLPWGSEEIVTNEMVFGGNLMGIIHKLDYIKQLGITGIYFTPIFESPSTHKYDTTDYYKIDSAFGDNETLKLLIEEAHKREIKVMLDGVFNHCGYYHPYWQDVIIKGKKSMYYDCFYIDGDEIHVKDENIIFSYPTMETISKLNYRIFGTAPNMPKWNTSNPIARAHLIHVGRYWIENYNIDGWRLDVSNEVSHDFWRAFRKEMKTLKEDLYIIGENWDNSYPWVQGDQFDGVMNYELLNVIWNFIGVEDIREKYSVKMFVEALGNYTVNYPKNILPFLFNMVDSHDTARVMTVSQGDIRKAKLIYLLQFILPGSPSIMYGSEIGLKGNFESARGCMIFNENTEKHPLYVFLKELIDYRKKHEVFRTEAYRIEEIFQEKNSIFIVKTFGEENLYVLINNSHEKHDYQVLGKEIQLDEFSYYVRLNNREILSF
ncbi:MAG: alpha-glycosidase [Clostridia bacterium]|nr:alpha-glycosidase [Clostridia bacterium]